MGVWLMRRRVLLALLVPTWRALPWRPIAAGGGLGLALISLPVVFSAPVDLDIQVKLMRLAALAGALGATFLLDEPSRSITCAVPTSRLLRHGLRAMLVLPAAALWWVMTLSIAWYGTQEGLRGILPLPSLTVEAAALLAVAVALSATTPRFRDSAVGGPTAAAALLGLIAVLWMLPESVTLLVWPDDPRWAQAHVAWAGLLLIAVGAFLALSREPLRTRAYLRSPLRAEPDRTGRS